MIPRLWFVSLKPHASSKQGKPLVALFQKRLKTGKSLEERSKATFKNRLGKWRIPVIVAARLTPGLMQVSSVAAGTTRIPYHQMALSVVFSFIVYDGTLIALGTIARLGLGDVGPQYSAWIVIGFVGIMTAIFAATHLIRRKARWGQRGPETLSKE